MVGLVTQPLRLPVNGKCNSHWRSIREGDEYVQKSKYFLRPRGRKNCCITGNEEDYIKLFRMKDFRVGAWNLQGGLHSGFDFSRMAKDLQRLKVHVSCLQETHYYPGGKGSGMRRWKSDLSRGNS